MKQINDYVEFLYRKTIGSKETEESKLEMKNHLLESIEELKAEGHSEAKAINIAIERFGGKNVETSVIGELFNTQKTFAKRVLYAGIVLFLMSLFLSAFIIYLHNQMLQNDALVHHEVESLLSNRDTLTAEEKSKIDILLNDTSLTKSYTYMYLIDDESEITSMTNVQLENYINVYHYEKNNLNDNWFFIQEGKGYSLYDQTYITIEVINFSSLANVVVITGIALYWVLFTIWAIITAYHHRRLNLVWTITFALFNVLGYIIYNSINKKVTK